MECPICREPLDGPKLCELTCKHSYHLDCIKLLHDDRCPMCRSPISEQIPLPLAEMRKRRRDDAAEEEVLLPEYIGPGTKRFKEGLEPFLQYGTADALRQGIYHNADVTPQAVSDYVTSMDTVFSALKELKEHVICDDVYQWVLARLPRIPPGFLHEMAHDTHANMACETIHNRIRIAWIVLMGAQLLEVGLLKRNIE
jgi:hypothetical protein